LFGEVRQQFTPEPLYKGDHPWRSNCGGKSLNDQLNGSAFIDSTVEKTILGGVVESQISRQTMLDSNFLKPCLENA
jgi:hypothetical protein